MKTIVTDDFALAASLCEQASMMCPESCPSYGKDECLVDPHDQSQFNALGSAVVEARAQRDTAWQELREIREAIKADENESTADEVRGLLAKYLSARRTLEDHGPEGHNVTNQQYVDLRLFLIDIGTALIDSQEITTRHVQWTCRGMEMKSIHDRLEKIESVITRFKEAYHVG